MSLEEIWKSEYTIPVIMGFAVMYLVFYLIFYSFKAEQKKEDENLHTPTEIRRAVIISKETLDTTHYYVVFEFDNGDRKKFAVEKDTASEWIVNDTGTVKYKGSNFVNFIRIS